MQELFKKFSVAYLAGAVGGAALAIVLWFFNHWTVFKNLSLSALEPSVNWNYLAPMVFEGSLWALLIVPVALVLKVRGAAFGLILSLIPSLYALLVQYPAAHQGLSPFTRSPQHALMILAGFAAWGLVSGALYQSQYK